MTSITIIIHNLVNFGLKSMIRVVTFFSSLVIIVLTNLSDIIKSGWKWQCIVVINYFFLNKIIKYISRYKVIGITIVNGISGVGFVYLIIVSRQLNLMQTQSSYIKGIIQPMLSVITLIIAIQNSKF